MRRLTGQAPQKAQTFKRLINSAIGNLTGYELSPRRRMSLGPVKPPALMDVLDKNAKGEAIELDYAVFDPLASELHVMHDAGLYSCLTVTLWSLTDLLCAGYIPRKINFSNTLPSYKDSPGQDLYPKFFSPFLDESRLRQVGELSRSVWQRFDHHGDYASLSRPELKLLVDSYFRPCETLIARTNAIEKAYIRSNERYVGVCYRGTDKATEVMPTDSSIYLELAERLLHEHQADRILIQTDQEQVSALFRKYFGSSCDLIENLPRTRGTIAIHNGTEIGGSRLEFAQDMMASVALMARMKHVVVYTGNVGAWIALIRGSNEGVWQATPKGIVKQWPDLAQCAD